MPPDADDHATTTVSFGITGSDAQKITCAWAKFGRKSIAARAMMELYIVLMRELRNLNWRNSSTHICRRHN